MEEPAAEASVSAATPPIATNTEPVFSLPADQLKEMMSDGTRLFQEGKYDQAADLFLRTATADPQNADARLAYAIARFATGDYELAASAVRQGIRMFPGVVDSVFDLRESYGSMEDFDRHWQRLAERLQDRPDEPDALLVLGFVYHFVGDREHAAEIFGYIRQQAQADAEIADIFLNAKPLPRPTTPAASEEPAPPVPAIDEPATAVVPAPAPATSAIVFQGRVSRDHHVAAKELLTVDGIVVKVKDTDEKPLDADLEIRVGHSSQEYEDLPVGSIIGVIGQSGQRYQVHLTNIDDNTETVSFMVSP